MNIIKVNYDNVAVKKPLTISPSVYCFRYINGDKKVFRIEVAPNLDAEPYFKDYYFEIYVDGLLYSFINSKSDNVAEIINPEFFANNTVSITVKGYYTNQYNEKYEFEAEEVNIAPSPVCSEHTVCSEYLICSDSIYGYIHEGRAYETREFINGTYIYSNEIISRDIAIADLETKKLYKWNSDQQQYVLL